MKPDVSFFNRQQQLRKAKGQLSGRRNLCSLCSGGKPLHFGERQAWHQKPIQAGQADVETDVWFPKRLCDL